MKLLEENIGEKLFDMSWQWFFEYYTKNTSNKRKKINKRNYIKLKSFCTAKDVINKMKRLGENKQILYAIKG